jgi:hypothetical protein
MWLPRHRSTSDDRNPRGAEAGASARSSAAARTACPGSRQPDGVRVASSYSNWRSMELMRRPTGDGPPTTGSSSRTHRMRSTRTRALCRICLYDDQGPRSARPGGRSIKDTGALPHHFLSRNAVCAGRSREYALARAPQSRLRRQPRPDAEQACRNPADGASDPSTCSRRTRVHGRTSTDVQYRCSAYFPYAHEREAGDVREDSIPDQPFPPRIEEHPCHSLSVSAPPCWQP